MTSLAAGQLIVLADHALAQRKRARRFWGTMGVLFRFEDHQAVRSDRPRGGQPMPAIRRTAFETRAPRSR